MAYGLYNSDYDNVNYPFRAVCAINGTVAERGLVSPAYSSHS
jgi:hypothetical protein